MKITIHASVDMAGKRIEAEGEDGNTRISVIDDDNNEGATILLSPAERAQLWGWLAKEDAS